MAQKPRPIYSHGGAGPTPPNPVPGNVLGAGRPIDITASGLTCPPMHCFNVGTASVTFYIDGNSGLLDSNFTPPALEWFPQWSITLVGSNGVACVAGSFAVQPLALPIRYWRTRIVDGVEGYNLISYVGCMLDRTGQWITAKYPDAQSVQVEY